MHGFHIRAPVPKPGEVAEPEIITRIPTDQPDLDAWFAQLPADIAATGNSHIALIETGHTVVPTNTYSWAAEKNTTQTFYVGVRAETEHGGVFGANPHISASHGNTVFSPAFLDLKFEGLDIRSTSNASHFFSISDPSGWVTLERCLVSMPSAGTRIVFRITNVNGNFNARNCVVLGGQTGFDGADVLNHVTQHCVVAHCSGRGYQSVVCQNNYGHNTQNDVYRASAIQQGGNASDDTSADEAPLRSVDDDAMIAPGVYPVTDPTGLNFNLSLTANADTLVKNALAVDLTATVSTGIRGNARVAPPDIGVDER